MPAKREIGEATPYGPGPQSCGGRPSAHHCGSAPGGNGTILYRSDTPEICTVDADGGVTGVSVGSCEISFKDMGDSGHLPTPWSDALAITVEQGEIPTIDDPYGASPKVGLGGSLELEKDLSMYGAATFRVADGDNCAVDEDGVVTPTEDASVGDTCDIQVVFAGNDNYAAGSAINLATVTVALGAQTVKFSEPYGANPILTVGESLVLENPPVTAAEDNENDVLVYQAKGNAGVCTLTADGTVTAVKIGECTVQARSTERPPYGASDWIDIATIPVGEGVLPLEWNPNPGRDRSDPDSLFRVGVERAIGEVEWGSLDPGDVVYSVADAGDTGCAFKGTSGADTLTLTFESWGLCLLRAVANKDGYGEWIREAGIDVRPGKIGVTAGSFTQGDTLKVGGATKTPDALSDKSPADADFRWQLVRGEKDCELLDPSTGEVRARAVSFENGAPECSLLVVGRKRNHETYRSAIVHIPLEEGALDDVGVRYGLGNYDGENSRKHRKGWRRCRQSALGRLAGRPICRCDQP